MSNKQIEAMKLALKALENSYALRDDVIDAKEALREALMSGTDGAEQPAPVQWSDYESDGMHHNKPSQPSKPTKWLTREEEQEIKNNCTTVTCVLKAVKAKLYTSSQAQPRGEATLAREPLTDEQCDAIYTALDEWSREVDEYDFGLPAVAGGGIEKGREIIKTALGINAKGGAE